MANTYTLISSNVLASSAASVTFSAIPADYTDLVVRASVRSTSAGTDWMDIQFNSNATNYSDRYLLAQGSSATSGADSYGNPKIYRTNICNSANTSNTFSSTEIYIPSYGVSQSKPVSVYSVEENNSTTVNSIVTIAALWGVNTAISSIVLTSDNAANFVSGSSFYLYGISNA
jgi:hypothetical protein